MLSEQDRTQPASQKLHLLILGATGPSGLRTVELALTRQHTITIYARSPDKLPDEIKSSPLVTIVKGELNDETALSSCFEPPPGGRQIDAIVSALGPKVGQPRGTPITKGYEGILRLMRKFSVNRLVLLSTISHSSKHDEFSVVREGLVAGIRLVGNTAWEDVVATGKLMELGAAEGLQVTLARVSTLTDGKGGTLHVGYIGAQDQGWTIARVDLAAFFIGEAEEPKWAGEAPVVSSDFSIRDVGDAVQAAGSQYIPSAIRPSSS